MYLSSNQKNNCLAIGSELGFRIISLKQLNQIGDSSKVRKIRIVEMYFTTNIIFLVSDESPSSIVVFNDAKKEKEDTIQFAAAISRLVVRLNNLYVLTQAGTLHVVDIDTFEERFEIPDVTYFPKIIIDVPLKAENFIGWNQPNSGVLKIIPVTKNKGPSRTIDIKLHGNNSCVNFVFDRKGELIGSNSKGTIIKIYEISKGTKKSIWLNYGSIGLSSLAFTPDNQFLIVTQANGEIKLVKIMGDIMEDVEKKTSLLGKLIREKYWMKIDTKLENALTIFNPQTQSIFVCAKNKEIQQYKISFGDRKFEMADKMNLY
jgi:WD40 repeat protein